MDREPWFLDALQPANGSEWLKTDEISWNQSNRHAQKHQFFVNAFDFIVENNIIGDYHEFGCHRARTFRMALLEAKRHFLDSMSFYAYDSFQGLPELSSASSSEHNNTHWAPGSLATSEDTFISLIKQSNLFNSNIHLIPGFYSESLSPSLFENITANQKASFVNIDCDFYDSALPIFNILDSIVQEGTVLYIDDYFAGYRGNPNKGVSLALNEWLQRSKWKIERYLSVGWAGLSFIVYI